MPDSTPTWSINPFALAELITGQDLTLEKDPGQEEADLARVRSVLEEAFAKKDEAKTRLEFIFESDGKTPARLDLFQKLLSLPNKPQEFAAVLQLPLVRDAIEFFGKDKVRIVLPYLVPVTDRFFAPPGAEIPAGQDAVIGRWRPVSSADYVIGKVSYLDPKQGVLSNCYLISAMIALAWTRPDDWTAQVKKTGEPYHYRFHRGPQAEDADNTEIAPALPLNIHNRLAYARSATDNAEGWPGMFEKAFLVRNFRLQAEPTPADYHELNNKWYPHEACQMLAGGEKHEQSRDGNPPHSEWLAKHCEDGITTMPTMASTWPTTADMGELGWTTTGLIKDHAYAVLGAIRNDGEPPANGKPPDYVVLRNPHGHNVPMTQYKKGVWPGRGGADAVNLNTRGVFALPAHWFDRCMRAIHWVEF